VVIGDLIKWIVERVWEAFGGRRTARLLVHHGYFSTTGRECYFLNVTNLSRDRDIEVTHVWFATEPEVAALPTDRPLPKRLKPDETWETWVEADRLPALGERLFTLGRARLSTKKVIWSRKNEHVPSAGTVPGGGGKSPPA
jgi:hypothetical protein